MFVILTLIFGLGWLVVKRSGMFITVLLGLFMFQSLWNVAAAFCDHESERVFTNELTSQHFGHHVAVNCSKDQQQHQMTLSKQLTLEILVIHPDESPQLHDFLMHLQDDHSDHLPSFSHFIIVEAQQQANVPLLSSSLMQHKIDWVNLYQSPHLYLPNPPPVLFPL